MDNKTHNKPKSTIIYLTEEENKILTKLAKKNLLSKSKLVRKLIQSEEHFKIKEKIELSTKINKELIFHLHKIGVNINQIAQNINFKTRNDKNEERMNFIALLKELRILLLEQKEIFIQENLYFSKRKRTKNG